MNQGKIKITLLDIDDLVFDKFNPNKMTESQFEGLKEGIKHQKFNEPIIVMRHELDTEGKVKKENRNLIANGEHRALAMKELGYKTISAVYYDMTEGMRLLIRQTHNKGGGTHDATMDSKEFQLMQKLGVDLLLKTQLSMSDIEFDKIIEWGKNVPEDNESVSTDFDVKHSCNYPGCKHGSS